MFNKLSASKTCSALFAIFILVPPTALLAWYATAVHASYGNLLFVGIPFMLGFVSVSLYNWWQPRSLRESIAVASIAVLMTGSAFLVLGLEGLICMLMALIIAWPLAILGGLVAHAMLAARRAQLVAGCLVLFVPMLAPWEGRLHHGPAHFVVRSSIEIAAPPDQVWQHVIAFSYIPERPTSPLLRTGIAYPIQATISGNGAGAVRHCVFTTGAFEEPIDLWDAPHRLHFTVAKQPPVMNELTWVPDLKPEHITREYLRSREGQFLLTSLPSGHTLLQGTTWYDLQYWPSSYWHLWSDAIIHRIHMRVLEHIKAEVERG